MSLNERVKYAEMKARHQKLFLPWYKKWWGVIILILIGLILIAATASAIYIVKEVKRLRSEEASNALKTQRQTYLDMVNGANAYATGAIDPKITIVEFTDFACPFCKQSSEEIRNLVEQYKQTVRLVVRDYPIHDTSINLALAARCAGEQGKYWEAYDSLFLNQDNLKDATTIKTDVISWAESLNSLDMEKFKTCFDGRGYVSAIKKDYEDGESLKIQGTPTWFVNNYPITGYYSADKFQELFNGILQQLQTASSTANK